MIIIDILERQYFGEPMPAFLSYISGRVEAA
jgi:hypothetical protein